MPEKITFAPTPDEAARQNFSGALKGYINFAIEPRLLKLFEDELIPAFEADHGRKPSGRDEAEDMIKGHPLYQLWGSLTFQSQNMMWQSIDQTTNRTIDSQIDVAKALAANPAKLGSVRYAQKSVAKAPVKTTEIHRQPGGYLKEARPDDIAQALSYMGSVELYRNAKGMGTGAKPGQDDFGRLVAGVAKKLKPDFAPTAILDMGCGTGEQTLAYKRLYPQAQVSAIDVARPFVRFAHALAEGEGVGIDFAEMDAGETDYPDESFDFITSIIMFHETSRQQVRDIFAECRRLLKPGGLALHLDVPYQPHRMPLGRQVTNHWQVRHNGEPFWTGFADVDVPAELKAAGFADPISHYEALGAGEYYFFGGVK